MRADCEEVRVPGDESRCRSDDGDGKDLIIVRIPTDARVAGFPGAAQMHPRKLELLLCGASPLT